MLNTRNEESNTVFYSYLACCMNTSTLRMYIYRVNQAEYGIRIRVAAPQEYVNIYSTRRLLIRLLLFSSGPVGRRFLRPSIGGALCSPCVYLGSLIRMPDGNAPSLRPTPFGMACSSVFSR